MSTQHEPATHTPPVRRFTEPGYVEVAATLAALRQRIDALDTDIVALLAQRAQCVRDATRFKRDKFQVAAPARQAQVFAKVRALAQQQDTGFPGFDDIVEATYRSLVAGFIAAEGQLFEQTETLPE
jgi:isochorismate pyruvate lyase